MLQQMEAVFRQQEEEIMKIDQEIDIPNQPQIILDLNEELSKLEPDFKLITNLVRKDIALTARIIKIANAPFWGLKRKVDSIQGALLVLGLRNFKNTVLASCLKNVFHNGSSLNDVCDVFFKHSTTTASVARYLADNIQFKDFERVDKDHAYLVGLFHDCGIMLMAKKFDDYLDNLNTTITLEHNIIDFESSQYSTNHCVVSALLIKKWDLPEVLIEPILHHHCNEINIHNDIYQRKLALIVKLSEHFLTNTFDLDGSSNGIFDFQFHSAEKLEKLLPFINMDKENFMQLESNLRDLIQIL
jgi:HD-like signal output (HDOD) protein